MMYDGPLTSHGIGSPSNPWNVYEYGDGGWYAIDIVTQELHRYDILDAQVWTAALGGDAMVSAGISGQFHLLQTTSVRRLDADGLPSPAFGPNGRSLCEGCGPIGDVRQVDDGDGGVFIAWVDGRRDPNTQTVTDLYGTWYRTDGVRGPGWHSDGELLATSGTKEELATIVGDRRGSAIVAWRDQRFGNWDLFAARLTSVALATPNRGFATPESAISADSRAELRFSGARPNPSSSELKVQFSLSHAGDATLRLIDVVGRELDRRSLRGLAAGGHTIALDAGRVLPPGLYLLELDAEGRHLRSKVVLTR